MNINEIKKVYSKKDNEHNFTHILRLKKNVRILKKNIWKINEDLLEFLILYHGLKDYVTKNKKDFDDQKVISLLRHNDNPKTIEEKIVFDANMLDNLDRQGIRKSLCIGKKIGRNKEETFNYLKREMKKAKFYTKEGKRLGREQIRRMRRDLR
ncbi:hypothetical protein J4402_05635 [Candidatus Pacearchaeota archaeon]|nr:hypothetical protein [Candidatus Pacearchaeota archaeon]